MSDADPDLPTAGGADRACQYEEAAPQTRGAALAAAAPHSADQSPPQAGAADSPLLVAAPRRRHVFAYAIVGLLGSASLVCVALLGLRFWYSHTYHYGFLLWNLVLAWAPFAFAAVVYSLVKAHRRFLWVPVGLSALVWLAFFPNAPYILTDFLHLGSMGDVVPGWYDVLMLYWYALTGLLLGIVSLYLMQEVVARGLGLLASWAFVVVVAGVGSLGIYLGRFLRWNSWDLVRRPGPLAGELLGRVTDPHSQPRLLGFTVLFALLFLFVYVAVYVFAKLTKPPAGPGPGLG